MRCGCGISGPQVVLGRVRADLPGSPQDVAMEARPMQGGGIGLQVLASFSGDRALSKGGFGQRGLVNGPIVILGKLFAVPSAYHKINSQPLLLLNPCLATA